MAILGDSTAGGDDFPCNGDRCLVGKFTSDGSGGAVSEAHFMFSSASTAGTNAKFVLLADAAGVPSTVLATSAGVAVPAGGGTVDFSISYTLAASTDYWIGAVTDNFQAKWQGDSSGGTTDMANGTFSYTTPPATWPGTDGSYSIQVNAWLVYAAGGGGGSTHYQRTIGGGGNRIIGGI